MDSFIVVNDRRGGGGEGKGTSSYGVEGSEGVTATSGGGVMSTTVQQYVAR